ncbi:hypothetical protein FOA52_002310 [Chlamydomonas sp. UWO 241]|nr:hypothetical protein FOA52_002310 [Chlamydomonas sp. UWO 241]
MGRQCCCCSITGFASITGFFQCGLSLALLALGSNSLVGHDGTCMISAGARGGDGGADICAAVTALALLSLFSALILSVTQGLLTITCGAGSMVLEVVGRAVLAVAWLVLAVVITVLGAKAIHHKGDRHAIGTAIGCAWAMVLTSIAMLVVHAVQAATCCCCAPCWRVGGQNRPSTAMWAEVLCLAWLYHMLTGKPTTTQYPAGYYAPVPGGPHGHYAMPGQQQPYCPPHPQHVHHQHQHHGGVAPPVAPYASEQQYPPQYNAPPQSYGIGSMYAPFGNGIAVGTPAGVLFV